MNKKKLFIFILLVIFILSLILFFPERYLHLQVLQQNIDMLHHMVDQNKAAAVLIYIGLYFFVSVFAIPGAAVLTILGGALFGFWLGFIASIVGSTLGAIGAFVVTRYLIGDFISHKFFQHSQNIRNEFEKNGDAYLLTLRVVPIFPFFMVNLLMGLTPIKFKNYILISFFGMMPGSAVYTYAGLSFAHLISIEKILTPPIFIAFTLLGLLPHFSRFIVWKYKRWSLYRPFKRPKEFNYNVVVIGAGSAGLVTANICATLGAKVALIEKNLMGGECLNTGCVPSKTIMHAGKLAAARKTSQRFGVNFKEVKIDFEQVMSNVRETINEIAPNDSKERYESMGVECFSGAAQLISPWEISINGKTLSAKNIVLATGASPRKINIPGSEIVDPLTSETLWNIKLKPNRLLVIGGGPVGCELAQAFARLGTSVMMIVKEDRLLLNEDILAAKEIEKVLKEDGIEIFFKSKTECFTKENDNKYLHFLHDDALKAIEFDEVLLAIGRAANSSNLGKNLTIELNKDGTFKTNNYLQTTYHNIYACGDCAGPYQYTHFASHQAKYVALNALFSPLLKFKANKNFIPKCLYTSPEVASIGKSANQLSEENLEFDETIYSMNELDRAIIESEEKGFVKILTAKNSSKILGVTIVAAQASLMIQEFILAMENNLSIDKIVQSIHPYPGFNEANKSAATLWKKAKLTSRQTKLLKKLNHFFLNKVYF